MANLIAPTSSRENRKGPTNVPAGVAIIVDGDGDYAYATGETADAYLVVDADGDFAIADADDGSARGVAVGGSILVMEQ